MIEIKAYFAWKPATKEKALSFARWFFRNMTGVRGDNKRIEYINSRHVRGTRFTLEDMRE